MTSEYVSKATERYSSLFTLPSFTVIISLYVILYLLSGMLTVLSFEQSFWALLKGVFYGLMFLFFSYFLDLFTSRILLKSDAIFDVRRTTFLTLVSNFILLLFFATKNLFSYFFVNIDWWVKTAFFGLFIVVTLRFLVFSSISIENEWKLILSAIFQPFIYFIVIQTFLNGKFTLNLRFVALTCTSSVLAFGGVHIFSMIVNKVGLHTVGISSISLFKAFIQNWIADINEPLESILEKIGEEKDVKISVLGFKSPTRYKAIIVVPSIHPGPFKNVGSSLLPSLIQKAYEEMFNCVVAVPHGISGHELDLTSQTQNLKVIKHILNKMNFKSLGPTATSFIQLEKNSATVGCQIFGGQCAFITLTLAPSTMEDLPPELDEQIQLLANEQGLKVAIPVDAHNSIDGPFNVSEAVNVLKVAVKEVLKEAVLNSVGNIRVGASKILPTEFSIKDGMGPGGITAIIIEVRGEKVAYITIDGNNMISNLRSEILHHLSSLGITKGEILTTDTHVVNGVVMAERGYRPIGEVMERKKLLCYIEKAVKDALKTMENAEVFYCVDVISGLKVFGEKQLDQLCIVTDMTAKKVKQAALLVFPTFTLLFLLLLILFF